MPTWRKCGPRHFAATRSRPPCRETPSLDAAHEARRNARRLNSSRSRGLFTSAAAPGPRLADAADQGAAVADPFLPLSCAETTIPRFAAAAAYLNGNPERVPMPSRALAEPRGARPQAARERAWRWRSRSSDAVGEQSSATPTRSMGTLKGFPCPPALWRSREGRGQRPRGAGWVGGGPEAPTQSVSKARWLPEAASGS